MTEIILIRHGETEWNVSNIFRGRLDIALNENGIKQAEQLAEYLSHWKIDAIYSSPLKRALQTAETVARPHKLPVQLSPGLTDFDFGKWQGLSRKEVNEKYKEIYADWLERPHLVQMPDGENLGDVRKRALATLDEILAKNYGAVVIVSHRVINKVLICALLGLDDSHFWNIEQDTCGVTMFKHDGKRFILARHNDTSFMNRKKMPSVDF